MWIKIIIETVFTIGLLVNAFLFIPQIVSLIRTKNAQSLSLITFGGFLIMQVFTAWHGYLHQDYALTIGFGLSVITCGIVAVLIMRYRKATTK